MSFGFSYISTHKSFQDKVIPYMHSGMVNVPESGQASMYLSNWKETRWGPGISASNLSRVYKNYFMGMNLALYLTKYKFQYIAKEHISGDVVEASEKSGSTYTVVQVKTPYEVNYERRNKLHINLLFKIAYCFAL